MNRCFLNRGYLVGVCAIVVVNLILLLLVLKPSVAQHHSMPQATIVPETSAMNSSEAKLQIDPFRNGEFWFDYSKHLLSFAPKSRTIVQEEGSDSVSKNGAASATDPASHNNSSLLDYSAIGAVIRANGGKIPATGEELCQTLEKLGDFSQLPIPFSSVALDSGLSHPRVVITQRPSFQTQLSPKNVGSDPEPIGSIAANHANLMGRLFLAANMEVRHGPRNPWVKSVEFISWNSQLRKFDFGVIEEMGESPVLKFVDGVRCITCHKNKGPILGNSPWSNSSHDSAIQKASSKLFTSGYIDGMRLLSARAPDVDAGVRMGADLLQNRMLFQTLIRSPKGRETVVLLLSTILENGSLETLDRQLRGRLNNLNLARFLFDATALNNAVPPSRLVNFTPDDSPSSRRMGWCDNSALVAQYDTRRAEGHHGLSGDNLPSNPKAFQKPTPQHPTQNSDLVSAAMLARTIGLTEGDRKFLSETLTPATKTARRLRVYPSTNMRQVLNGPQFSDILTSGDLPDRDDFKDRFVAGLSDALRVNEISDGFLPKREQ